MPDCILDLITPRVGHCWLTACGNTLPKYHRKWCSRECALEYVRHHSWSFARPAVLRRDNNTCHHCGGKEELEVNHIIPRVGEGYGPGCWNHQDNLEVLCRQCHQAVTNLQRAQRQQSRKEM